MTYSIRALIFTAALSAAVAGCAALEPPPPNPIQKADNLEPMLSAAGFHILPADTVEKQQQLESLLPLEVQYYVGKTGTLHYWMADPYNCKCMYIGSEQAYQKYEQMRLNEKWEQEESRVAEEDVAAQQEEEMNMQMEMFNPYGMGYYGPVMYY